MPLWDTRKVENKLRCLLGLQARPEGWTGPGFRSHPDPDGSGYFTLEKVSPEKREQDYQQIQSEGWRGELASSIARSPYSLKRLAHQARWKVQTPLQNKLALRQIGQSRWLTFESPYVLEQGGCQEVEGWLKAPGGSDLSFTVTCTDYLQAAAKSDWNEGRATDANHLLYGSVQLLVPEKLLTQETILLAIQHWYMEEYGWDPTHWSSREGKLPLITLQLEWQDWKAYWENPYDPSSLPDSETALRAEQRKARNKLANQARARRKALYKRFGLS